jgi:hypothetical protein
VDLNVGEEVKGVHHRDAEGAKEIDQRFEISDFRSALLCAPSATSLRLCGESFYFFS